MFKKYLIFLISAITMAGSFFGPAGMLISAYASDLPVIEEAEPEGAVHGEVIIQALRYRDFSHPIQLDFYPEFDNGVHRTFILRAENGYKTKELLMVGPYRVAAGIYSDKDIKDINVQAVATPKVTIKKNPDSVPVIVALEGTESFIRDYNWLTTYEDDVVGHLEGTITDEEAEEYFEKTISSQTKNTDDGNVDFANTDGEIDYAEKTPEEVPEEEALEFEAEEESGISRVGQFKFVIIGVIAVFIATVGIFVVNKRKRL